MIAGLPAGIMFVEFFYEKCPLAIYIAKYILARPPALCAGKAPTIWGPYLHASTTLIE